MAALWLGLSAPLSAATLKDALDHAWIANAPAQSARAAQFDAQQAAAGAWLPEPPTLTLSGRSEPGPKGLPVAGMKVAKGQLLAYLVPAVSSIERANQQA